MVQIGYLPAYLRRAGAHRAGLKQAGLLSQQRERQLLATAQLPLRLAQQQLPVTPRHQAEATAARNALVEQNLLLVAAIARQFVSPYCCLDDLIEDGNLGLMRAVERYDLEHPGAVAFATYATWWVKQAMRRTLGDVATVFQGHHLRDHRQRYRAAEAQLGNELGRPPSAEQVAARARLTAAQLQRVLTTVGPLDCDLPCPESELAARSDRELELGRLLGTLSERERHVLECRYGIGRERPLRLRELGAELGLTRERVRQIENLAREKLRKLVACQRQADTRE